MIELLLHLRASLIQKCLYLRIQQDHREASFYCQSWVIRKECLKLQGISIRDKPLSTCSWNMKKEERLGMDLPHLALLWRIKKLLSFKRENNHLTLIHMEMQTEVVIKAPLVTKWQQMAFTFIINYLQIKSQLVQEATKDPTNHPYFKWIIIHHMWWKG